MEEEEQGGKQCEGLERERAKYWGAERRMFSEFGRWRARDDRLVDAMRRSDRLDRVERATDTTKNAIFEAIDQTVHIKSLSAKPGVLNNGRVHNILNL